MEHILRNLNAEDMDALKELLAAIAKASEHDDSSLAELMLDSADAEKARALTRIAEHIRNNAAESKATAS